MDSWYATQRLMALIDNDIKIYYCLLKMNRLVDDTVGVEKYKNISALSWNELEKISGKIIKIKGFPRNKKVKLFWVTISANRTEYIVTNDFSKFSTDDVNLSRKLGGKQKNFTFLFKQLTGIEFCQCRQEKNSKKSYYWRYFCLELFEKKWYKLWKKLSIN